MVAVGKGIIVNVTSPLIVLGPQDGLPVVDMLTKEITAFEFKTEVVEKSNEPFPVPVSVLAEEPSITLNDHV